MYRDEGGGGTGRRIRGSGGGTGGSGNGDGDESQNYRDAGTQGRVADSRRGEWGLLGPAGGASGVGP